MQHFVSKEKRLLTACKNGDVETVWTLLKQGVLVNCKTPTGNTPLHRAVRAGHEEIVRVLLGSQGIDVNAINKVVILFVSF
jgi:ankyrin repeat protein